MRSTVPGLAAIFCATAQAMSADLNYEAEALFIRRVLLVFNEKCLACHGNDEKKIKAGFDMRTRAGLLKGEQRFF